MLSTYTTPGELVPSSFPSRAAMTTGRAVPGPLVNTTSGLKERTARTAYAAETRVVQVELRNDWPTSLLRGMATMSKLVILSLLDDALAPADPADPTAPASKACAFCPLILSVAATIYLLGKYLCRLNLPISVSISAVCPPADWSKNKV